MKITIDRQQLLGLLALAGSSTGKGKDVLTNVKLTATDGLTVLVVEASDGQTGLVLKSQCEIEEPGKALLEPGKINQILGPSNAESVTIETTPSGVTITAGRLKSELPSANPDEFPSVKIDDDGPGVEIPAAALCSAIRQTKFAVDTESTRYQLGGVLFEFGDDALSLVGTDGRRLSTVPVEVSLGQIAGSPIVPLKGLDAMLRAFSGAASLCLKTVGGTLQASSDKATIVTTLVEGRYPNWRGVMPKGDWAHKIPVEAGSLAAALRQASVTTENVDSRGVELRFVPRSLTISSKGHDRGKSEITMPVDSAADIAFTIDWRFALDFAKEMPEDEILTLHVNDPARPIMLSWNEWVYVIMPMAKN